MKEELDTQEVVAKIATTTKHGAIEDKTQTHMVEHYNLDVIIFWLMFKALHQECIFYQIKKERINTNWYKSLVLILI